MWEDIEVIECLGERGDIIDVTKQTRMIDGQRQQRWLSSRGNEILFERSDGHFDTENGGEIIARIPD
jgi:RNase P/RNase MRP subunit p29